MKFFECKSVEMDKIYILFALSTWRYDGFAAEQESDNVSNVRDGENLFHSPTAMG